MKLSRFLHAPLLLLCISMQGCSGFLPDGDEIDPSAKLTRDDYLALRHRQEEAIPPEAMATAVPPIPAMPPEPIAPPPDAYGSKRVSVTVTDSVPVRDVLLELAREAGANLELDPRIQGGIIFSAHEQPFEDVLKRICALAGLRYKTEDRFIRIELDEPYQQSYTLDYLSLARRTSSEVAIATNVFDVDVTDGSSSNGQNSGNRNGKAADNNSTAKISGTSDADFWAEVEKSLAQILASGGNPAKVTHGAADKESAANKTGFSIDRQSGIVTIFASSRQQDEVARYFRKLRHKANAQVLIEARIVEVELDDAYKAGINWRTLFSGALNAASRFGPAAIGAPFTAATTATDGVFTGSLNDKDFAGIINLVRTFGTTRVLSSPRLTVLNNQTAVLKVATNQVYFVTSAQFTTVTNANGATVTTTPVYTSTPRTVPVGLVMTVQPAIDTEHDLVTMTLRPTISRVVDQVNDPSIGLNAAQAGVINPIQSQIPVLAVREMDSVLRLHSGEVAVMGGLMQDTSQNTDKGIPYIDTLPVVGNLAKSRDNEGTTTELVILLRATITDGPLPDMADANLYRRYSDDPRPLPVPVNAMNTADIVSDADSPSPVPSSTIPVTKGADHEFSP